MKPSKHPSVSNCIFIYLQYLYVTPFVHYLYNLYLTRLRGDCN